MGSKCKISRAKVEIKNVKVGQIFNFKKNWGCFVILKFIKSFQFESDMWPINFSPPPFFFSFLFFSLSFSSFPSYPEAFTLSSPLLIAVGRSTSLGPPRTERTEEMGSDGTETPTTSLATAQTARW